MRTNAVTNQKSLFSTKQMVTVSLLSALAYVLMLLHLPVKYLGFLEFEFSDIPAVIAALTYGPFAGVIVELVKNLIKALTASSTGMVGELANFIISSAYIIPVGILYKLRKAKKLQTATANGNGITSSDKTWNGLYMIFIFVVGTVAMSITGALLNYFVTLPLYAKLFGGMDVIVGIASANVSAVKDLASLVIIGITPFNIVKGIYISIIGYYTYRFLKGKILQ
ncbi:MAG: rane protein-like protein [Herbinix sp.]|jgi:riboflavin transporter FmnP|nr:rane protein-like protein [Herbinix sp.]